MYVIHLLRVKGIKELIKSIDLFPRKYAYVSSILHTISESCFLGNGFQPFHITSVSYMGQLFPFTASCYLHTRDRSEITKELKSRVHYAVSSRNL